jgi:phage tail sheath gpL-like
VNPYDIVGFSSTDFVPGYVAQVLVGGALTASGLPLRLLLVGNKTSSGTMVANQDIAQCFTQTDADTLCGSRSELARMYEFASKITGVEIWLAPVTESVGAQATMTVTYATTATGDGEYLYYIGGRRVSVTIFSGYTVTQAGDALVAAIAADPHVGCTGVNSSGTVTLTWAQRGPRGNDIFVRQDTALGPTGMTSTLGGTGGTVAGIGQKFGGGTTADDLTTVATNSFAGWYHRVALAARDATQLAAWETSMDAKAAWNEMRPQHTVAAHNGSNSAAISLAQTTLNNRRVQLLQDLNGESDPAEIAALFAAMRAVTEEGDPGADYDGAELMGVMPHKRDADSPQRTTAISLLRAGVTPLATVNGVKQVVRSITTRCLDGSNPDYRTLDTGTAYVPDYIRYDVQVLWLAYRRDNPIVAPDPAPEQPDREEGVATPSRWSPYLYGRLKDHEKGTTVKSGLPQLIDVDLHKPTARYDTIAKRIMFAAPLVPAPRQHQIGGTFIQL